MAQRIFRCQGSRQELEGLRNQGNGWCGDHTELVQELKIPPSKPPDRIIACHAQHAKSTSLCERVRTAVLSDMAPVTSPRNSGAF